MNFLLHNLLSFSPLSSADNTNYISSPGKPDCHNTAADFSKTVITSSDWALHPLQWFYVDQKTHAGRLQTRYSVSAGFHGYSFHPSQMGQMSLMDDMHLIGVLWTFFRENVRWLVIRLKTVREGLSYRVQSQGRDAACGIISWLMEDTLFILATFRHMQFEDWARIRAKC